MRTLMRVGFLIFYQEKPSEDHYTLFHKTCLFLFIMFNCRHINAFEALDLQSE